MTRLQFLAALLSATILSLGFVWVAQAQQITLTPSSGAFSPVGTSGASLPLLNGANTWSGVQTYGAGDFVLTGAVNGDIGTFNTSAALQDSGTLLSALAPLASPTFTGTPAAPTASSGTSTTQLATTAFVQTSFAAPPSIGNTTPASGAFTTLSASSTVSGTGFSTYLASPPAIGGTAPAAITATTLSTSGNLSTAAIGTTTGVKLNTAAVTINDSGDSGTVADGYVMKIGGDTLTATSATTFTNIRELDIEPPVAGSSVTFTNTPTVLRLGGSLSLGTTGNINNVANVNANNTASYELDNSTATATAATFHPVRTDTKSGIGADTAGDVSIIADNAGTATEILRATGTGLFGKGTSTSGANQTGYWCYDANQQLIRDTTVCLVSLEELKNIIPGGMPTALSEVLKLKPFWYTWKQDRHPTYDTRVQPGLGAHAVEKVDSRLVAYTKSGKLEGVRYEQMTAVLVAAIQQQQSEIASLKRTLAAHHIN